MLRSRSIPFPPNGPHLTYQQFPEHFTLDYQKRTRTKRRNNRFSVGRVYMASPGTCGSVLNLIKQTMAARRQLAMHACYTCVFEKLLIICRVTASVCSVIDPDWLLNGMQAFLRMLFCGLTSSRY